MDHSDQVEEASWSSICVSVMPEYYDMKHSGQRPSSRLVALWPEGSDPPTAGFVLLIQRAGHVSLVPSDAWSITRVENQHPRTRGSPQC